MDKEKITVSLTEDEFLRFVLSDALDDDGVKGLIEVHPSLLLFCVVIGKAIWKSFSKFSRMQKFAEDVKNTKED